jgi:hypothetical protein
MTGGAKKKKKKRRITTEAQRHRGGRSKEEAKKKQRRNIWRGITWIKRLKGLKTKGFSSFFLIHVIPI